MGKRVVRRKISVEDNTSFKNSFITGIVGVLVLMYMVTGILLLVVAALIYQFNLSLQITNIAIILIYVITGLIGGFVMGKRMKERRYLWGLAIGATYFFILLVVSLIVNGGKIDDGIRILITAVLCIASAMVGGMIS